MDDLLDNWQILGEGIEHHTEAGHHGIHGGDSTHHAKAGIEIWKQEKKNKLDHKAVPFWERREHLHSKI